MHRLLAAFATLLVSVALVPVVAGPAQADHSSESHSTAQFLDGSLLPIDLSTIVGIDGASADYLDGHTAGTEVHENANLDVTALSAVTLPLPDLEIALGDLLSISAVNQEAWADPAGDSRATTGAADLSLDLTALLGPTPVLDTASIHLGAVQSYAELDGATGDVTRTTTIADATVDLHSPLVGQTVTSVNQAVGTLTDTLSTLDTAIQGSVNDAVGDVLSLIGVTGNVTSTTNVTVDTSRLDDAISGLLTQTLTTDLVSIDLTTGQVTVNLAGGIDLNNLPPNSTLLSPEVLQLVSADIAALLAQLQTDLDDIVSNALDYVDITIASSSTVTVPIIGTNLGGLTIGYTGTVQDLLDGTSPLVLDGTGVVGTALDPLLGAATTLVQDAVGATIDTTLGNVLTTTGTTIDALVTGLSNQLAPVLELLTDIVAVNLNVQTDNPDGSYSVTAVEVEVLPGVAGGVVLPLATSTVGPNVFAPLSPVLDATNGPVSPGADAPVTSTGWNPSSEVTLQLTDSGGNPVGDPFTVTTDPTGAFPVGTTFPVPTGIAAGTYTLVGTDLLGNTANDALTVITPTLTAPADPVAPGTDAPLTSTGWTPATVVTVQLTDSAGDPVGDPITVTTDANGAFPAGTTYPVPDGAASGDYTLVATDPFGNTASDTLTVDATAPVVAITSPADGSTTNDPTPTITGTLDDPTATVNVVITDADGTVVFDGPATVDPTTGDWTVTPGTPLPEGDYTVVATATDPAGNSSTDTVGFTIDTTAPVIAIISPADGSTTNDPTPTVTGTLDDPTATVNVVITDGGGTVVFDGPATVDPITGDWTVTPGTPLPEGDYTVTATATDPAGNTATDTAGFTIDTTAPAIAITSPTDGSTTNDPTPTITGTLDDPTATVNVVITDGTGTVVFDGPATVDPTTGDWTVTPGTPLPEGDYTVVATATDPAGNTATDTATFTLDTTTPVVQITDPTDGSSTNDTTPTITGTVDDPTATVDVVITDGTGTVVFDGPATVTPDGTWTVTPGTPLPPGDYTVTATATDLSGNTATDSAGFTIDTAAPVIAITSPTDGSSTNDTTPTITGTLDDPTATVNVVITDGGGTVVFDGPATVDPTTGDWTVDSDTLVPGSYTVTATATDPAGNTATDTAAFTVDTTAPVVAITSPTDGTSTNDTTPTITGTLDDPTATVNVVITDGTGAVVFDGPATVDPTTGDWSVTPGTPLPEGDYLVTATATDPAGNTATDGPVAFTVDTTTPVVEITSPTGTIDDNAPTITGTVDDPTATVNVVITDSTGTVVFDGPATVNPTSGDWTVVAPVLADGDYTITATATDPAGNTGTDQATFTVDTAAPVIAITSPTAGELVSDATPTVTGTLDDPTATVDVVITHSTGTVVFEGPATVDPATGDWTIDVPTLADGDYTVTATATDPAGNTATDGPVAFTVDSTAPVVEIASPTGATNDTTPTVTGTLDDPTATVNVVITDSTGTVVFDGPATVDPSTGDWTVVSPVLADGDYTVTATATDPAGNTGTDEATFTVDATPPVVAITSPTEGASTNDTTPTVTGTLDDPTATVDVVITDADGAVVFEGPATVDPTTGDWTIDVPALADGDYTVTATATDPAGNTATDQAGFTVDASAPAISITSPTDGSSTSDTTPTIAGTVDDATASVVVTILDASGNVVFEGPATVDPATGTWTVDSSTLPEGDYTVSATATDGTGNEATAGPVAFRVDTTAPSAPVITSPADGDVTSDNTPPISGTGESGATVEVTVTDADGTSTTYEAVVDGDGNWTVVPTTPLSDGDATVTATQTDAAGNTSPASDPVAFTVDTTAPAAPVITSPADGSSTTDTTPVVTGTGEPGATVTVSVDGVVVGEATVGGDGTWQLALDDPLAGGEHTVTATQTDPAGNTSAPASSTFTVESAVAPPVITSPAAGATVGQSPNVSGTGIPGASVTLLVDGAASGTATVGAGGRWSLRPDAQLACGIHTLAATQTVDGVTSAASDTVTVTVVCPAGSQLPGTGAPFSLAIVMLLLLLAAGGVVGGTALVRRRR